MITTLTIVRHGVTDWNLEGRAQGHAPTPLNLEGHGQARHLAHALAADGAIDAIYCSDLLRCRQTADPISEALGLAVRLDERLREIDLGNWQGLTRVEWEAWDPERYAAFAADPVNVPFPGGENRPMLARRVLAAVDDILDAHAGQHVLVVTHGGPVRAILRHYGQWPGKSSTTGSPAVLNTSRSTLLIGDDQSCTGATAVLDVSHLPDDLRY
ncbi:MAG: histidine phosphatase family protein [Anaerolineae bacterium]|nr:histidine phosphatase family protein [Anaerolineae bacterium]